MNALRFPQMFLNVTFTTFSTDHRCMSEDGGSPRPPDQMDVELASIPGPIAPVSPVPSTNSKDCFMCRSIWLFRS